MNCPACASNRVHAPGDWARHPYAGHGFQAGQGWTHQDLAPAPDAGAAITSKISGEISGAAAPAEGKAHANRP
jgi:hypothetical protein